MVLLRSLVLSARETPWLGGCPQSPSLGQAREYSQRNPEKKKKNLSRVRRHCYSAHQWCSLRSYHSGTRRVAAESPLRGGASSSSGPLPLIGLSACTTGSRLRQPLFRFLPVSSVVTPEVEVGVGRPPRRGRKAEAEREREAEPGELLW